MEEARKRREEDEADWTAYAAKALPEDKRPVLLKRMLKVTTTSDDGKTKKDSNVAAQIRKGEDAAHGAFMFCAEVPIIDAGQVKQVAALLLEGAEQQDVEMRDEDRSVDEMLASSRSYLAQVDYAQAGAEATRAFLESDGRNPEAKVHPDR